MPPSAPGGDRLSSAILYAAIIAIWAGVLIPRWLKRSAIVFAETSDASDAFGEQPVAEAPAEVVEEPPARRRPPGRGGGVPSDSADRAEAPQDPGRRRVLAARRRLLGLLVLLAAAAGALAGTRMAAWWVVVPPSVMLFGYLPLLRAASKVDAERRELAARYQAGPRADYSRDVGEPVMAVAHVTPVRLAVPAEIVDAMAEDEIYDQYTDAKLRAVGD
jgi:hypothetical protein